MLHILLMILKIIGIILASALGLLLFLLLLVLFVPIRYRASGAKTEEQIDGNARISWLFGIAAVSLFLKNKDFSYDVKIFGISFNWIKSQREKLRRKQKTKKTDLPEVMDEPEESLEELNMPPEPSPLIRETLPVSEDTPISAEQKEDTSAKEKVNIVTKVIGSIRKMRLTIQSICDKINYWKNFLQKESTKEAIALLKKHLTKLFRHIMPKKLKGNVIYGFEDPCKTGQVLAGICVFYPVYYKHVNICPDFTQNILLGDVELKGRIYVCFLLKTALCVFFDKNIQHVWKKIKNRRM